MYERLLAAGIAALFLSTASPALAADGEKEDKNKPGPWNFGAITGLNLSQSSFSNNWAGGDQGSITWVLNADLSAQRQFTRKFNWNNTLLLAYGQTSKQETAASGKKKWTTPDKTTDLIQFESLGRFTLNKWADPYVGLRLDSQFIDEDPIGNILFNPIRLKQSGGLARVFQKTEERELISRVGFGFRQNIAREFTDATGDATESFTTNDGGAEWQTDAKYPLAGGKIQYKGQLLVFLPVFYSASTDLEDYDALAMMANPNHEAVADYWKQPDVNFQNSFDAKVTEWLSVNLYLQWIYDKFDAATNVDPTLPLADVDARVNAGIRKAGQFKQTLALGITYRFL